MLYLHTFVKLKLFSFYQLRKNSRDYLNISGGNRAPAVQSAARHYTDWAITDPSFPGFVRKIKQNL
jgi:hypothetical protein